MDRDRRIASQLGKLARWALMEELVTTPKPGLVDGYSNGAHRDMNFQTFEKHPGKLFGFVIIIVIYKYKAHITLPLLQDMGCVFSPPKMWKSPRGRAELSSLFLQRTTAF